MESQEATENKWRIMYELNPADGTATYGVPQDDCGIYISLSNSDRPALVSPEDYERAEDIDWWLNKNGYVFGRFPASQ
jgi:hypothetical protein